jgi:predicted transcriptional regulator
MRYFAYFCNMRKHNGMRPQDIVILLKITTLPKNNDWKIMDLVASLNISQSEISESLNRSSLAGLIDISKKKVMRLALMEFLEYGIRYVFPQHPGALARGIPTAHSHPFMKKKIISSEDYVWASEDGKSRGQTIEPLLKSVNISITEDEELYELLAMVDVLRVGKTREKKIAIAEIKKALSHEPSNKY